MLIAEYDYNTDVAVQRDVVAEQYGADITDKILKLL